MSFAIIDWNLNPNQDWFVVLSDTGTGVQVKLYPSQADAVAGTNLVAAGGGEYGDDIPITLVMASGGAPSISVFNAALEYHISVSGMSGDASKTYHVAPFVDLPEISNSIYRSAGLINARAQYEINLHTHTEKQLDLSLAGPYPDIEIGNVLQVQSTMRGIDVLATVTENVITGTPDSLVKNVGAVEYTDLSRG